MNTPDSPEALLEALDRDPYPLYATMRASTTAATWVEALGLWMVTRHADVQQILRDDARFLVGTEASLIHDTFGAHMLTSDGPDQVRQKAAFRGAFAPARIRAAMAAHVDAIVAALIDGFARDGKVELRKSFAARLPVLAILRLFGLAAEAEADLRQWYDAFEAALANFTRDPAVRARAAEHVVEFHALVQAGIDRVRAVPGGDLLSAVVHARDNTLTDDEICRNAAIIFFGGISTVEALILNAVHALALDPALQARVAADKALIPLVIEETMRWTSPVQSATRHTVAPVTFGDVTFPAGATVNCMLGAANRDPSVFPDPDRFDIDRPNLRSHLGFAAGPHFCLGSHLAKLECASALDALLTRCSGFTLATPADVRGYEFRQPRRLDLIFCPA